MTKGELIAALAWLITAIAPENEPSAGIMEILGEKADLQKIVELYRESLGDSRLMQRFFPEE